MSPSSGSGTKGTNRFPTMSTTRILPRLLIILVFAIIGASIGVALQALRVTGRPQ